MAVTLTLSEEQGCTMRRRTTLPPNGPAGPARLACVARNTDIGSSASRLTRSVRRAGEAHELSR